jgi:hypothetical protein
LFRYDLFQIAGFTAQVFNLVSRGSTGCITGQPPLTSFHEVLGPFVIDASGDALTTAQLSDAVLASKAVQDDPDLLFG